MVPVTAVTHACAGSVCRVCGPNVGGRDAATRAMRNAAASAHGSEWADRARTWIARRFAGETFTADDVVDAVGLPSGGLAQNGNGAVGAVFAQARRAGLIEPIGWMESTRPTSHARPLRVWQRVGENLW